MRIHLSMRTLHVAILLSSLTLASRALAGPPAATATPSAGDATQQARAHFNLASAHVERKEYDEAIREFEAAYRLKPAPSFLYNIGVVNQVAGKNAAALDAFQRYLGTQPGREDRVEAERRLAEVQRRYSDEKAAASAAASASVPGSPAAAAPAPAALTAESGAGNPLVASAPAKAPEKKSRRTTWIVLGAVGGALVVGAVVTAVVVGTRHDDGGIPSGYHDLGGVSLSLGK
jgi:tetratricopeptide (TPR) repeat protein